MTNKSSARVLISYAAHVRILNVGGRTEYSVLDDNTDRKIAHVSVIRGFAHLTGSPRTALDGVTAVVRLNGPDLSAVETALKDGLRNGRDDRN